MSSVNNAILRVLILWFHVGIGPMIGRGPMEACHAAQARKRGATRLCR
jgi:hypothetical protein